VGEHLLREPDRAAAVRALRGRTAIKICGITTAADALGAVDAGADFIGLVFAADSPRRVLVHQAESIAAAVRASSPRIRVVGVFRDQALPDVASIAEQLDLDLVQLHGSEPASYLRDLGRPAIRAIAVGARGGEAVPSDAGWAEAGEASWVLLDGVRPGSGETFDWSLASRGPRPRRMFLAGGLSPANVRDAVMRVRPDGVDVSSGVEDYPGKKNIEMMRRFVAEAREA
jgi:phosphoribosylanthranilate isomerase